tara:strand:+ start:357 stop:824 length:468 start_codon:yes stop_codon:yes gene_type:complete
MIKNLKIFLLILSFLLISFSYSQENLENNLIGKWEFKLNIKDVIKNSDDLTGFEKLAARTFSGVIEKALEKTQIFFDFKDDKTAAIEVVTAERSESRVVFNWEIDEKSNLILDEITDQSDVRLGDTAYWSFNDDKLIPYDSKGNINEGILLIKLK